MKRTLFAAILLLLASACALWSDAAVNYIRAIKQDNGVGVAALLRQGVDPNTCDARGVPGLYMALQEESLSAAQAILKSPYLNPNLLTPTDESPLMMAALKGQLDMARILIAKGAAINKTGWTPLHYAATGGHTQIIRLLIERGAQLEAPSPNGTTPLMMAARYGSVESVEMLLRAGADPRHYNELGMDALDFAVSGERYDMVQLLAEARRRARAPILAKVPAPTPTFVPARVPTSGLASVSASGLAPVPASAPAPVSASAPVPVPASASAPISASASAPISASASDPISASASASAPAPGVTAQLLRGGFDSIMYPRSVSEPQPTSSTPPPLQHRRPAVRSSW